MTDGRKRRVLVGTAVAAGVTALGVDARLAVKPGVKKPGCVEGQPLLEPGDAPFHDTQLGLRFNPPPAWAMQARSAEAPGAHKAERMVVKYKRLVKGPKVAWLRVSVADADATPAEALRTRKPREQNW